MRKLRLAVAAAVAISGISYLVIGGLKEAGIYWVDVGELLSSPELKGKRVRVEGEVVPGSVRKGEKLEFEITDGEKSLPVVYGGPVPSLFREGRPVVVEGRYVPKQGVFRADMLLTKCPSKYEAER